jgi:hypothetical protein
VISFSLLVDNLIKFNYLMNETPLTRLQEVEVLGITYDRKLLFSAHVDKIRSRAMQMLGILYRVTDITDEQALRAYFVTCVLPIIEYCSLIWSAAANTHLKSLDRVTTFFCNIVKYRVHEFRNLDKNAILPALKLNSLLAIRQKCDLVYFYNIVNGRVDCPILIQKFFIRVPTSTRNDAYFLPEICTHEY